MKADNNIMVLKVLRVFGIREAYMAEMVKDLIDGEKNLNIESYAKDVDITLRITAKGGTEEEAKATIVKIEKKIRERLNQSVYGEGDTTMEEVVAKLLLDKHLTIATAESCTGGLIAATLINYPGISEVFMQGCVTYSNEAKMQRLGVKKETLDEFGAVSEQTALEMAEGITKTSETNVGISSTGIAGPGGGTEEKPVGLVYVGICINGIKKGVKFNFKGDRQEVRQRTVINALDFLRRELLNM